MTTRALAILGLALATSGCVDAKPNLFVTGICGTPDDAVACKAPQGKCDTAYNGHLEVWGAVTIEDPTDPTTTITYANSLSQVAQVENRSPSNANEDIGRVNGMDAIIETARIKYASAGLTIADGEVRSLFTPVPAPGTATIFLPIMSAATVAEITAQTAGGDIVEVLASVRLGGHYADGSTFETGPFDVPVYVFDATFDATNTCTDPTQIRYFCYSPGQGGGEKCAAP